MMAFKNVALAASKKAKETVSNLNFASIKAMCEAEAVHLKERISSLSSMPSDLLDLIKNPTPEKLMAKPELLPSVLSLMNVIRHPGRAAMAHIVDRAVTKYTSIFLD
jgi:hypothetical protein